MRVHKGPIPTVIFTCQRDRDKAAAATRTIPADWPVAWVVDLEDANIQAPPGVEVRVRPFPRGRNLYGREAVLGVAATLFEAAAPAGRVLKIDSDCLLLDPERFRAGDLAGMAHGWTCQAAYGLAYALSLEGAAAALAALKRSDYLGTKLTGEDICITAAALTGGGEDGRFPIGAFWESKHKGEVPDRPAVAIHCGAFPYAPREGLTVAREMARLGDLLGAWRR